MDANCDIEFRACLRQFYGTSLAIESSAIKEIHPQTPVHWDLQYFLPAYTLALLPKFG